MRCHNDDIFLEITGNIAGDFPTKPGEEEFIQEFHLIMNYELRIMNVARNYLHTEHETLNPEP